MNNSKTEHRSLALLTDLYQVTMARGYWGFGRADEQAVFHLTYRVNPFDGGYAIACGLAEVIEWIQELRFDASDLDYLGSLNGANGQPLFESDFLSYLRDLEFRLDIDAIPEGTVVFPHEPLIRVQGPLAQCQLIETGLLNLVNFQTLIATKASRICHAAGDDEVLEFGLRRAQGIDGGLSATRSAYIGGCSATSNVLAGKIYDIPVRGTHAHSWVMSFDDELEAFETYARAMPNNCVFLVDTFDTIEGVKNAITVAQQLRARGHEMIGIRLDSGDLADLSRRARKLLDDAGLPDAKIVASNDLDEFSIQRLKAAGAQISVWGVGTKLATGDPQPALGGVYKLSAIRDDENAEWNYKVKQSNDPIKVSNPGVQQVRRWKDGQQFANDVLFDEACGLSESDDREFEDLLVPVFRDGKMIYDVPSIHDSRRRTAEQLSQLPAEIVQLSHPKSYLVTLDDRLQLTKNQLIAAFKRSAP